MAVNIPVEKNKDWFKLKRYPHIGFPLKAKDRVVWIEDYVTNPERISQHAFLPFIHKKSKVRKFRKVYSKKTGILKYTDVNGKKKTRVASTKERELFYAGHLDSLIYSYYAELLTKNYEKVILEKKLSQVITAYRKIPFKENSKKNKCNIDFAVDVFKSIKDYPPNHFIVIAFDITGFFDNLNHQKLRTKWNEIIGNLENPMPKDHFNVFKNITRFSYIDLVDIFKEFQNNIFVKTTKNHKEAITRKRVSKIKYLKKSDAVSFCTKEEFILKNKKLVKKSKHVRDENGIVRIKDFGIPQGSPISSILANIYMLDFDFEVNEYIKDIDGIYKRYSDDMVVVCPLDKKQEVISLFDKKIQEIDLKIQNKKTQIFHFHRDGNHLKCGQEFEKLINFDKNFIYLGLEFDGTDVKIKSASLSGFYRKMKRTIKRAKHFSSSSSSKYPGELFKRRLLNRFTYKGAARRRKYIYNHAKKYFEISTHFDWGNFLSYAYKARAIKFSNKIKSQTKRHWNKIDKLLK
ncbi:reverse transcriptase domain-containing protein [Flavobacterium tistrianum]|uniref:reverse transcriptase domain-containing protein n=1 Tax=Flavobacterium tistrianum TaxID=1685414 RepID=UPI000DAB571A|nr:reverse transcriptase domain-containing protein [Flavobacterium tistrianum]KAF2341386.1 RNA-dependent DNA polymerase [Flavobacterium tistrianum]